MVRLLGLKARLHLLQESGQQQRQGLERRLVCGSHDGLAGCRQNLTHGFSHHSTGKLRHPELGFRAAQHFFNAGELGEISSMDLWNRFTLGMHMRRHPGARLCQRLPGCYMSGAHCIASTYKTATALPYFFAACFLTSGMTYLPNISIDDMTLSCGIVSVAIRNCNSSPPIASWRLIALRQLSGSPATRTPRSTSVSASN